MATQKEVKEIEISIEDAKAGIAKGEKLKSLLEDERFIEIFVDGFMGENVTRIAKLSTDSNMGSNIIENKAMRDDLYETIAAAGHLRDYISGIMSHSRTMQNAMQNYEDQLKDIQEEGLDPDTDEDVVAK